MTLSIKRFQEKAKKEPLSWQVWRGPHEIAWALLARASLVCTSLTSVLCVAMVNSMC